MCKENTERYQILCPRYILSHENIVHFKGKFSTIYFYVQLHISTGINYFLGINKHSKNIWGYLFSKHALYPGSLNLVCECV